MDLRRILRHAFCTHRQLRRTFPPAALAAIEQAVKASEAAHTGELRFAIEAALGGRALLRGQRARERAIEVFSRLRVWDTEHNNGVLIYVLLADRAVEIVADRGIDARVGAAAWAAICRDIETAFGAGRFSDGALAGIAAITAQLRTHFPAAADDRNELPDAPVVL
ncbi:TLP18.3/Psb32/MOLO-1 phosphatase superfamily protein [Plasticicumulans lactativorans]|uniref:TLP18.3/Psb32/MOLO-1 phosphatase superfamily protein n=1 Tax=Plasticicumulans lactativorans TaxID=1133106 RepID=A0A4V2SD59_9GAMM|nr:TPM domain-containing protein [Plasticicumulans lactativorans]TCO82036.1 TLP18.3/Psb32/MOLO-1 phosphatase superfamily protein [Plasticicumulans lactativorans]